MEVEVVGVAKVGGAEGRQRSLAMACALGSGLASLSPSDRDEDALPV
jgi:hypothetical protein